MGTRLFSRYSCVWTSLVLALALKPQQRAVFNRRGSNYKRYLKFTQNCEKIFEKLLF
jgi:hypothetical protein